MTLKEWAEDLAQKKNATCLTEDIKRAVDKILWRCDKGHEFDLSINDVELGRWCPLCGQKH